MGGGRSPTSWAGSDRRAGTAGERRPGSGPRLAPCFQETAASQGWGPAGGPHGFQGTRALLPGCFPRGPARVSLGDGCQSGARGGSEENDLAALWKACCYPAGEAAVPADVPGLGQTPPELRAGHCPRGVRVPPLTDGKQRPLGWKGHPCLWVGRAVFPLPGLPLDSWSGALLDPGG